MSRVNPRNKHMNTPKGDERCQPGPVVVVQPAQGDYKDARTFPTWRKLKYGMSTKAFSRKSPARKAALRAEYHEDTGYIAPTHPVPPDWDEDELDTRDVDAIFQSVQEQNKKLYEHFEAVRQEVRDERIAACKKAKSMDEWLSIKYGMTRKGWKRKSEPFLFLPRHRYSSPSLRCPADTLCRVKKRCVPSTHKTLVALRLRLSTPSHGMIFWKVNS